MHLKINTAGMLEITTSVYQGKSGGIYLNWGEKPILLTEDQAENVANEIPDINRDDFVRFYHP